MMCRCPARSRSKVSGARLCCAGRSTSPYATAGSAASCFSLTKAGGVHSSRSGRAGSHGLGWRGTPANDAAEAIALVSTARSVTASVFGVPDDPRLVVSSGPPRSFQDTTAAVTGDSSVTTDPPGRRPPTRADWNGSSTEGPSRTNARPGLPGEISPESGASMMSRLSEVSVVRKAIRRLVLARISGVTAPPGRWVASTR
jgi:hypothetical protein